MHAIRLFTLHTKLVDKLLEFIGLKCSQFKSRLLVDLIQKSGTVSDKTTNAKLQLECVLSIEKFQVNYLR